MPPDPPEPPDAPAADDPPEFALPVLVLLFLDVELQAARTPPASTTDSAAVATRRAVRFPVIVLPFPRWMKRWWSVIGLASAEFSAAGVRRAAEFAPGSDATPRRRWAR